MSDAVATTGLLPTLTARIRQFAPGSDVGLAFGVVVLLSVLILPLPTLLLDLGLALSITSAVLVLMVALFLNRPLDFSSFPTLLLLTTLLRLSLNVAVTRLILSHGNEGPLAAGHVVAAFGGFLMGGDVVIGLIIFSILLVVNFMVITKGSGRIAEVAARFSLDAMPGKQMAIDADLSSGLIDEKEARRRRRELEEESGFYGAMDGAAKFVRGDAIAALIITVINILGGLAIGVMRHGMSFADAAATFTTLTAGDGLVSQIPALLVSTAAGIVVTKGGMEGTADAALIRQLGSSPKPLAMAAGAATVLALLPGLPALPFMALAGLAGGGAWLRYRNPPVVAADTPAVPIATEQPISDTLRMDMIRLELGYGLLALAGGDAPRLTEQIKGLRRSIAAEMGFVLPPVRIQDNMQLGADHYSIRVKEIEAGSGESAPHHAAGDGPEGRHAGSAGRADARAGVRPAGALDRSGAEGRGDVPRLHRGRSAQRADHAPDRGGAREHGGTAVLRRDAEAAGRAAARAAEAGGGPDPVADHRGRRAARAAEPAGRTGVDPRPADDPGGHPGGVRRRCARHSGDRRACARAAGAADQRQPYRGRRLHPAGHAVAGVGDRVRRGADRAAGGSPARHGADASCRTSCRSCARRSMPPRMPARRRCC